jgi:hypothetical protein
LSTSAFQFFLEHNVRFLYLLSQQSLYKILHYCKTITLFVVIMPWRIFCNNYIHKRPWFEQCALLFHCTKSFLTRTVIGVCMSNGSHTTAFVVAGCLDILPTVWRLRWCMQICIQHFIDFPTPSSGCWCYEWHYLALFMYSSQSIMSMSKTGHGGNLFGGGGG